MTDAIIPFTPAEETLGRPMTFMQHMRFRINVWRVLYQNLEKYEQDIIQCRDPEILQGIVDKILVGLKKTGVTKRGPTKYDSSVSGYEDVQDVALDELDARKKVMRWLESNIALNIPFAKKLLKGLREREVYFFPEVYDHSDLEHFVSRIAENVMTNYSNQPLGTKPYDHLGVLREVFTLATAQIRGTDDRTEEQQTRIQAETFRHIRSRLTHFITHSIKDMDIDLRSPATPPQERALLKQEKTFYTAAAAHLRKYLPQSQTEIEDTRSIQPRVSDIRNGGKRISPKRADIIDDLREEMHTELVEELPEFDDKKRRDNYYRSKVNELNVELSVCRVGGERDSNTRANKTKIYTREMRSDTAMEEKERIETKQLSRERTLQKRILKERKADCFNEPSL